MLTHLFNYTNIIQLYATMILVKWELSHAILLRFTSDSSTHDSTITITSHCAAQSVAPHTLTSLQVSSSLPHSVTMFVSSLQLFVLGFGGLLHLVCALTRHLQSCLSCIFACVRSSLVSLSGLLRSS